MSTALERQPATSFSLFKYGLAHMIQQLYCYDFCLKDSETLQKKQVIQIYCQNTKFLIMSLRTLPEKPKGFIEPMEPILMVPLMYFMNLHQSLCTQSASKLALISTSSV